MLFENPWKHQGRGKFCQKKDIFGSKRLYCKIFPTYSKIQCKLGKTYHGTV